MFFFSLISMSYDALLAALFRWCTENNIASKTKL